MKKRITATKENREFLAKAFGVTARLVYKALSGESDSPKAKKIRMLALQRGAHELTVYDEWETWYDADGYMRQYFPNGAMLEVKKGTDTGRVFFRDTERSVEHITFQNIGELQREIMALA